MEKKTYLLFSKQHCSGGDANTLFYLGEMLHPREINLSGIPGFSDALHLLMLPPQSPPYQMISLTDNLHKRFYFQGETVELLIHPKALELIDHDSELSKESAYKIFKHFLIKRHNHILFLANGPNSKIAALRKKQQCHHSHQEKL